MSRQSSRCNITRGSKNRIVNLEATDRNGDTFLHLVFKSEGRTQARIIQNMESLLDRGLDINVKNAAGKTVLHLAIERCYKDVIDFCIARNANINVIDNDGNTLAHYVVEEEYQKCRTKFVQIVEKQDLLELENEGSNFVDWMVSRGFDFFISKNRYNQSALYLANEFNLQHIILTLLKYATDFASIESDQTPLLCAYLQKHGNPEIPINHKTIMAIHSLFYERRYLYNIIKLILEKNKSISNEILNAALYSIIIINAGFEEICIILQRISTVEATSTREKSLIQVFTNKFHERKQFSKIHYEMKILRELVLKGADVNERVPYGKTIAIIWLDYHPKLEMLQLLQDCGADFSGRTNIGETFLHVVGRHSDEPGTIDFLMKKGCSPNDIDSYGNSPLSLACKNGQAKVVEALIKYGANLNYKSSFGRNLLHLAVDSQSTVELLIKYGVKVNVKDNLGQTPLHLADCDTVIKTLYSSGAYIDLLDNEGNTPLYYGVNRSKPTIFAELLKYGADILEPKVFQRGKGLFQDLDPFAINSVTSQYVMEHLVKMSAIGLLHKISHKDHWTEQELQEYFKTCQEEVKSLKGFFVNSSTSLYELLRKHQNRRWAYANNEKLKNLVEDVAIEKKFPNYFILIMSCFHEAKTRQSLLEKATDVFNQVIQFILPELCIDGILICLSNMDLINVIEAGNNE